MRLASMLVRDIMTTGVVALREHQSLRLASALAFARGEDHLPVVGEDGRFLGLVNHRDLMAAERSAAILQNQSSSELSVPVRSVLSSVTETVAPDSSVESALRCMLSNGLGLLPVVSDQDGFCGLVTMDAMLLLCEEWAESLPETIGEMTSRALIIANTDTTISEAIHLMRTAGVRHLPVVSTHGKLHTVVSLRDLLTYQRLAQRDEMAAATDVSLMEFSGTEVWTTTSTTSVLDVVRILRDNQFGCLPIVEEGHLLGIITESDLLRRFLDSHREPVPIIKAGMPIRKFMSVVSPTLAPDDLVARALEIFVDAKPSTILVAKQGEAIGILSRSDLMHSMHVPRFHDFDGERERFLRRPIAEVMTQGILTIDVSKDVGEAAAFLAQEGVHSLVVLDEGQPAGTFGPHEIFHAAGFLRAAGQLRDIKTNVVFEIDCHETLRSGLRFLESAGVRGLVVRDGGHPVGIFGQQEALAAASSSLETSVEQVMSSRILCLPDDTPCFRAAQQAGALGVDQILVTAQGESCGLASASDFVHLLALDPEARLSEDTVDEIHR